MKVSPNPSGGNSTILSSSRGPRSGPYPPISMGAGSENSIRRVAAQRFCLVLGQYVSPLSRLAAGGSPGESCSPRCTATNVWKSDGEETFTGTYGNGEVAPIAVIPVKAILLRGSTIKAALTAEHNIPVGNSKKPTTARSSIRAGKAAGKFSRPWVRSQYHVRNS